LASCKVCVIYRGCEKAICFCEILLLRLLLRFLFLFFFNKCADSSRNGLGRRRNFVATRMNTSRRLFLPVIPHRANILLELNILKYIARENSPFRSTFRKEAKPASSSYRSMFLLSFSINASTSTLLCFLCMYCANALRCVPYVVALPGLAVAFLSQYFAIA
jgi:hypothetical protein